MIIGCFDHDPREYGAELVTSGAQVSIGIVTLSLNDMKADFYKPQIARLLQMLEHQKGDEASEYCSMPIDGLVSTERLAKEQAMFRKLPIIIAHSSEIANAGDYVVRQYDGKSWLITRAKDGVARVFYNYCQHRGTKLVHSEKGECQHRFSCPYHAWTYNGEGELLGIPRADLFEGLDKSTKSLKQASLQETYGFLWFTQDVDQAQPIKDYVGGLHAELDALNLGASHLYFDKTRELKANWKMPIFAFLESYHLAVLHKESIGEFFYQNVAHSEVLDPHIRSFVPRKNAAELATVDLSKATLSEYVTPTNILFPNVCMIAHPTSMSILSMFPGSTPGTSTWRHMLLVPKQPATEAEKAHYDKTIAVLDGITYEKEDFWVSEQSQEGIGAGAIEELVLSKNEQMLIVFDEFVQKYI